MERKLISVLLCIAVIFALFGIITAPTPNQRLHEIQKARQNQVAGESRPPHRVLVSTQTISQGDLVLYDHWVGGYGDGGEHLLVVSVNEDEDVLTGLHTSGEMRTVSIARVGWVYNIIGSNTDNFPYASSEFLKKLAESVNTKGESP